uniref:Uncharacterized protein K0031E03.38 n=1 Tax=Oryza sativa subsp. indica TaxID=39946 RepID=C8TEX9_ORYSI|nr:hypothetical protein [Oryza sativa Indica Group]
MEAACDTDVLDSSLAAAARTSLTCSSSLRSSTASSPSSRTGWRSRVSMDSGELLVDCGGGGGGVWFIEAAIRASSRMWMMWTRVSDLLKGFDKQSIW